MKTVVIVWWEIPESVQFIKIEPKDQAEYDMLCSWQEHFINEYTDGDEERIDTLDKMYSFFYDEENGYKFRFELCDQMELTGDVTLLKMGFFL